MNTVKQLMAMSKADLIEECLWAYAELDRVGNKLAWAEVCAIHGLGEHALEMDAQEYIAAINAGLQRMRQQ